MRNSTLCLLALTAGMVLCLGTDASAILRKYPPDFFGTTCFQSYDVTCSCLAQGGTFAVQYTLKADPPCKENACCRNSTRTLTITACRMRRFIGSQQPGWGGTEVPDTAFGDPNYDYWAVPMSQGERTITNILAATQETIAVPQAITDAAVWARSPLNPPAFCRYTIEFCCDVAHPCTCTSPNTTHSMAFSVKIQYLPSGEPTRSVTWSHGSWQATHVGAYGSEDCTCSIPSTVSCTGFCVAYTYQNKLGDQTSAANTFLATFGCKRVDPNWRHPPGETFVDYGVMTVSGESLNADCWVWDVFGGLPAVGSVTQPDHVMHPRSYWDQILGWSDVRWCSAP